MTKVFYQVQWGDQHENDCNHTHRTREAAATCQRANYAPEWNPRLVKVTQRGNVFRIERAE